jgi:hypothetical protein
MRKNAHSGSSQLNIGLNPNSTAMKKYLPFTALLLTALTLVACGGSSADDEVTNETITLSENNSKQYTFEDESIYGQDYKLEISSNTNGVNVELSRVADCDSSSAPVKSYVQTCRIKKDGIIKITNPTGPGAGADELVTVKITRKY